MIWPADFVRARAALLDAERDLDERRASVAAQRRAMPPGPVLDNYVFDEVCSLSTDETRPVALADLLTQPGRPLIMYHLMFGKLQTTPCPMCTMWVDGLNGIERHVAQRADLAVVAAADVVDLRAHAVARGWDQLRLLSAGASTFKRDLGSEDADGTQNPMVTVLSKDDRGSITLTYSATPDLGAEVHERGIDPLCATWSLLDLTPQGRGDWYASLSYD